ncbi:MAG TPA: amino acid permease, partial [Thermomicrobiales bacterium]|nr:amino acid permease [Thermomicrobiales bacterium]
IHRHYQMLATTEISAPETPLDPAAIRLRVIVPVASLDLPARQALAYALAITDPDHVVVVHVTDDEASAEAFHRKWMLDHYRGQLVVIESPFRSLVRPLVAYINAAREAHPTDVITVVLPEYVPRHWWEQLLHNQTALRIKAALLFQRGIVTTNVPYHMRGFERG